REPSPQAGMKLNQLLTRQHGKFRRTSGVNRGQLECLQTQSTYSSHFRWSGKDPSQQILNKLRRPQGNTQHLNLISGSDGDSWDWTFLGTIGIQPGPLTFCGIQMSPELTSSFENFPNLHQQLRTSD